MYNLSDSVVIKGIEVEGRIVAVYKDHGHIQYKVRYWMEGHIQEEYFYKQELEDASQEA